MTHKINQRKIELCKQYKEIVRKTAINLEKEYKSGRLTYTEYFFKLSKALKGRTPESWISYYDNLIYKLSNNEKISHIIPPKGTRQYFNFTEHILLVVVITLILSSALLLGSSSITGSAIFDVFKQPLIDLASNSYTQDQELLFAVNPTSAGVYEEVYILNQQGVYDSMILDCAALICYDTTVVHKDISQYAPGDYEIAVFDYNKNDYVKAKFTVGRQLEGTQKNLISHDFICNKCSPHKVPPLTNVQVVLEANNPGGYATISDYFLPEWGIINASNGYIVRYNSTHNKISWDVESNETILVFSYILFTPQRTLPPTEYYFIGEINGIKDEPWQVIVADPPASPRLNVSIAQPPDLQVINIRKTFNITSKVTCQSANCNSVFATAKFNITGAFPFRPINATNGEKPISVSNSRYVKLIQNLTYGFGSGDDVARDIVLDSKNMYVIGYQNGADWRIMKINLTGKSIWNRTYAPSPTTDYAFSGAIDSSQTYIYVAGYQTDADQNWRIMKLDINGNSIWNRTYNPGTTDQARQIRIDKNDDLYAVGSQALGWWRIMKLNANGISIWNFTFDPNPSYPDQANAVAIDKNNNIVVAGIDNADWRIMKLDINGNSIWNRTYNLAATDTPYGIGIDSYNNIYVVGQIGGVTNDWGIMKLDSNGNSIWNRTYNPGGSDRAQGILVDINDKIYVFGYHIAADADWRIMKLDSNGNSIWNMSRSIGITDNIYSIASDSSNLYAVGQIGITSLDNDWRIMKIDNSLSYQYCGSLATGQSCIFDWQINGTKAGAYRVGVYYNSTTSGLFNVTDNRTVIVQSTTTTSTTSTSTSTSTSTTSTSTSTSTTSTSTTTVLGTLNVSISKPDDFENVMIRRTFNITSKVTCLFNDCNNVYATPRYRVSQYARPDQDVRVDGYTPPPLWQKLDEISPDDSDNDIINSSALSGVQATNISLSSITDPVSSTGHILRYRVRRSITGSQAMWAKARIFDGNTLIATTASTSLGTTYTTFAYTLSGAEADSISSYGNLTLEISRNATAALPRSKLTVSWAELEVPSPFTPINATNGEVPLSIAISKYVNNIWNRTYNPGATDIATAVTIDSSNNIYAVGYTDSGNWFIMKINSTGGSIWNRTYNPGATDQATAVTIDSSNNIYAVGYVSGADVNWFIMKINSTGGSIWNRMYNPGGTDIARGVTIDSSNNIYAVGDAGGVNWFIMKLDAAGNSIWNRTYNPGGSNGAYGVTIDSSNNIYAVGYAGGVNWFIMKINSTGGSIWNRTYNPAGTDLARSVTIDSSNNIYAVGYITDANSNWFIMKINSTGGSIWNRTYNPGVSDQARGVTIDSSNNIYAVGDAGGANWFIMKLHNNLPYQSCGILSKNQACTFDWVINGTRIGRYGVDVYYNQSGTAAFNVTEIRNVIVFSTTTSTTTTTTTSTTTTVIGTLNVSISKPNDLEVVSLRKIFNITSKVTCLQNDCSQVFATARFNFTSLLPFTPINATNGETPLSVLLSKYTKSIWNLTYNLGGTDAASAVTIDSSNNIYIVGTQQNADINWRIMKLDASGNSIWNRTYNPGTTDVASAVTIDSSNNIYAVGYRTDADSNWFIMKIDSAGNSIWNKTYNPGGTDVARAVTIDSSNNIYTVGYRSDADSNWFIMKLDSNGNSIWNKTYNPGGIDVATGVTIDSSNNIYAVGYRGDADSNWFIMKIDSAGNSIWNKTYNPSTIDRAKGVTIDSSNNIYAVGYRSDANSNWFIMKIDSAGNSIWNLTYNPGGSDQPSAVTIDSSNNIYAVGDAGGVNWFITKIDSAGNSIWNLTYNPGGSDLANAVTIDSSNNIYVVGQRADADVNWFIMKHDNSLAYQSCGMLNANQECTFTWQINGTKSGAYGVGVYYNLSTTGLNRFNVTENRTVIVGASQLPDLTLINITIKPQGIVEPFINANVTMNATTYITNNSLITNCIVRVYNSTSLVFTPSSSILTNPTKCFAAWNMDYWRNSGTWDVLVNVTTANGSNKMISSSFTYNSLKASIIIPTMINFTGAPGQTVQSSNAFPMTIKNAGNEIYNISLKGTDYIGKSNNLFRIKVTNSTINQTSIGVFTPLTYSLQTLYIKAYPRYVKEIYFKTFIPQNIPSQDYEANVTISI